MLSTRFLVEKSIWSPDLFSCFPHSNSLRVYYPTFSSINKRRYHSLYSPIGYSVLKSPGLQHWFKNWQEHRKRKLTASTSGNLATCWTNIKEEEALARYKLITGNSVAFPRFQVYRKKSYQANEDWLAASPDGIVVESENGSGLRGVLEIKCPFFGGYMNLATPWKRVPLYYMPQAQGLMEILDRDWMDFYVWTPKGSSLLRIYGDVEFWGVLKEALSDFWWNNVHPARELCDIYKITDPCFELSSYVPEPRHELCTTIIHRSKLLVDQSDLLMREIHGVLQN